MQEDTWLVHGQGTNGLARRGMSGRQTIAPRPALPLIEHAELSMAPTSGSAEIRMLQRVMQVCHRRSVGAVRSATTPSASGSSDHCGSCRGDPSIPLDRDIAQNRVAGPTGSGSGSRPGTSVRMDRHCATRRLRRLAEVSVVRLLRMHPYMLRHTFVTTMLDAGVDLRDVQIAARHADPRTTMRYDRARKNLDGHPDYILAAYLASAT
jgi:hypothetical protein